MLRKLIRCFCGFQVEGQDDEIVSMLQAHAQADHNLFLTAEQILSMAEPA